MDGDGDPDVSRHPEPPARTPQKIEEQESRRLLEAKKKAHNVVEEHAGGVSSSEGPAVMDLSEFKALALNDTPPKLGLTDRSNECAYGTASSKTDSEIIEEEKPKDESDYYLGEKMCNSEDEWIDIPTFDSLDDAFAYLEKSTMAALAEAGYDSTLAHYRETSTSMVAPELAVQTSIVAPEQEVPTSMVAPEQEVPTGGQQEIARNGKKWMSEEAMVAFKKYMEKNDDIKGFEYQFDKLLYQCLNVEHYFKTFHHFNFTVKMRAPGSADWTSQLYFAEVKEILRQKNYICYPLEPDEEGHCYACENQGMDELRHPLVGGFDTGDQDTMFPYGVIWDSEEEDCESREPGVESDDEPW